MSDVAIEDAQAAMLQAYAPFSNFKVGAVLVGAGGNRYKGANIENVSFGLTMCAERVALGVAHMAGETVFDTLVLVADSQEPIVPCGACRQVLAEFAPRLRIVSRTIDGAEAEFRLDELLPLPRQGILDREAK